MTTSKQPDENFVEEIPADSAWSVSRVVQPDGTLMYRCSNDSTNEFFATTDLAHVQSVLSGKDDK